jgi:hypothetical protein
VVNHARFCQSLLAVHSLPNAHTHFLHFILLFLLYQDDSAQRRGGPCAHHIYGNALSINAGTAAYFLALDTLQKMTPGLTDAMRLKIYDMYFLTLRAGHCGQVGAITHVAPVNHFTCLAKKTKPSI